MSAAAVLVRSDRYVQAGDETVRRWQLEACWFVQARAETCSWAACAQRHQVVLSTQVRHRACAQPAWLVPTGPLPPSPPLPCLGTQHPEKLTLWRAANSLLACALKAVGVSCTLSFAACRSHTCGGMQQQQQQRWQHACGASTGA
jgi:hypothetical protein